MHVQQVSDFGMARHRVEASTTATTHGAKGGTFRWAAAETFKSVFTEASDVYSFGATLYEIATRTLPWEQQATDMQIMYKVRYPTLIHVAFPSPDCFCYCFLICS